MLEILRHALPHSLLFPMEINHQIIEGPPRAAATVVMLRDSAEGLQVLLLRRHADSNVLGGAYVFPGGKVDAADAAPQALARLDQPQDRLHAALAEAELSPAEAAGLYVAAVREAFEECGVLFVQPTADLQQRLQQARTQVRAGEGFAQVLARLGLTLDTRCVQPWTRWVTPPMPSVTKKRFDTRFFIAAVPAEQTARHDDVEATDTLWVAPRVALQQYWDRQIQLAPPQIMSLAHLSRHATVASMLAEAASRPPPVIMSAPFDDNGMRVICYPGDEGHPIRERAMPGPTRLHFRNQRFEPHGGFEGLFA